MSFIKHLLLFILLVFFSATAFSQSEPEANKKALSQFIRLYNTGQLDSLFNKCSPETKTALPLDQFKASFLQVKAQLGNLVSTQFTEYQNSVALYKATFEKAVWTFAMAINAKNEYQVLFFKPILIDDTLTETPYSLKTLAGTISASLVKPKNAAGKVPVVLIIAGSGPTDRNGNNGTYISNAYAMLANELGKKGIATLRYDKIGVGQTQSPVKESELKFDDGIETAVSLINDLNDKGEFSKIIVLGHSQGSLTGMIAANGTPVKGFISLAGAGDRADKLLIEQMKSQPKYITDGVKRVLDSLSRGKLTPDVDPSLYSILRPSVQGYIMSWCRFEPVKELKKLKIPVLLIQGTTDLQVGIPQVEKLKKAKSDAQLLIIQNMNHVLKDAPADAKQNMATYSDPNLPIKPELANGITDFINKIK